MNAPADPMQLEAELVPIDVIIPSSTHLQALRRKRFSPEGILELAASIQTSGVINPILLRPFPADLKANITPVPKYELVAGERRWLGAKRAGLAHIPAVIRSLDEEQLLVAQMIENKQRDDYTPLEEAAGYQDLKELKGYDADRIGELIGKSASYVRARLKLLALLPEARDALQAGVIDYSKALALARITTPKLQKAGLKKLTDYGGASLSYKRAFEMLRDGFMVPLNQAPFAHDDGTLFRMVKVPGKRGIEDCEALPACINCPSNSANDAELLAECQGAHVCTDKPCFEAKVALFWKRKADDAKAAGRTVLEGEAAKGIVPDGFNGGFNTQYLNLDAECDEIRFDEPEPEPKDDAEGASPEFQARYDAWSDRFENWRPPTYRQLLGADAPDGTLVAANKGTLVELIPLKDARPLLKAKGVKLTVPGWMRERAEEDAAEPDESPAERAALRKREEEKLAVEAEYRKRLAREIHAKCKGPLKRPDLERIADHIHNGSYGDTLAELYPDFRVEAAKEDALVRYLILALVLDEADDPHGKPGGLLELAARFKIDAKKIRADVVKELKPTSAPQPEEAADAAPKKAAKKKAAKK